MAIEVKASVAVDRLTEGQACEIFHLFGFEATKAERLYGGYASSNFKVVGRRGPNQEPESLLLKINYYGLSLEDLEHQLFVLGHLRPTGFPTNYPHAATDGRFIVESGGRRALLLDFIAGATPGSTLLARGEDHAPALLRGLAAALARLHQVSWPAEPKMRDVRSGYPVCSTGDLLRGEELGKLEADGRFAGDPVVVFCRRNLTWLRALYARDVPWGLIHGDGFLDNTLYAEGPEGSGECTLLGLIDWEDSCVGPLVLDLAVSASACCFTAANELLTERLVVLLREYHSRRPLSAAERLSLPDFMAAGALACAFYRFAEFNVRQPDSGAEARSSHRLQLERADLLLAGGPRAAVEAAVSELATGG